MVVMKRVDQQKENINMKSRAGLPMEKEIYNEDLAFCKNQIDINWDVADGHTVALVNSEARDNIVIADGVKTDVENTAQWGNADIWAKTHFLEDSSNQPNLKLIQTLKKSFKVLQEKSLNENFKKIGHNLIFDII